MPYGDCAESHDTFLVDASCILQDPCLDRTDPALACGGRRLLAVLQCLFDEVDSYGSIILRLSLGT
jgi:hypothetical protein